MQKERKKIPKQLETSILADNKHVCCICHEEGRSVQIHHINSNPSNNDPDNLCVLCLLHHDQVMGKSGFGKQFTIAELNIYKKRWEEECAVRANKRIPSLIKENDYAEVKYGEESKFEFSTIDEKNVLYLQARINYSHEAGSAYLMRIRVNGEFLHAQDLIKKDLNKKYKDGRKRPWFNDQHNSWFIGYSPNFKNNYFHKKYKVINGDPYTFIFDLSRIEKKGENIYEVVIEHTGLQGSDAYKNSIIIRDIGIFKIDPL